MRPRIKKHQWQSTSRGGHKNIRCSKDENIKRHVKTMEEKEKELKEQLQKTISRVKYSITKNERGERIVYIMTAKGNFGNGILC